MEAKIGLTPFPLVIPHVGEDKTIRDHKTVEKRE